MEQNSKSGVKICMCKHSISQYACSIWSCFVLEKFRMKTSPNAFFISSKFWFSRLLWGRGLKGQKMIQHEKKILSHFASQELYLIWLWFLVNIRKMISPANFFIFSKVWFFLDFQSSSINAKRKFLGLRSLSSHVCDFLTN